MGKKYYGGIGTDKGFVMHSPGNEYRDDCDDEFRKEGTKRDAGSASSANDVPNKSPNEGFDDFRGDSGTSHENGRINHDDCDDELDDFFGDLFFVKTRIVLAIESLFKALMSRSMKRIDFAAVTFMLLICTRVIGAAFIDSSSLSELNAFAFVVALSALGICTISEKCPANALTALVIACLPALIEIVTACAVNESDADAFNRITNWALIGCLGSAALLIVGTTIDPLTDEEGESDGARLDEKAGIGKTGNGGESTDACGSESAIAHEDAACERVFFIPFWSAAIGATAALIWELAPYIAREIAYGAVPLYLGYMSWIV